MSGGSGCQQIKLFVLRPGFGTLSLLSSFLPLSPCVSFFSSLFLFSQYFFFPSIYYRPITCTASAGLYFSFLSSSPSPTLLLPFSTSMCKTLFDETGLCWWSLCVCLYMCTSQHDDTRLCWLKPVRVRLCACSYLYVFVVHGAAWWDRPLLMKLQSQVSADLSSLPEERQMHCSGGRETAGREGAWKRQKSVLRLNPH